MIFLQNETQARKNVAISGFSAEIASRTRLPFYKSLRNVVGDQNYTTLLDTIDHSRRKARGKLLLNDERRTNVTLSLLSPLLLPLQPVLSAWSAISIRVNKISVVKYRGVYRLGDVCTAPGQSARSKIFDIFANLIYRKRCRHS